MPTLNWIGKEKVVNHHTEVPFHTLKKMYDYPSPSSGGGGLIIHGDNLIALKSLLPEYENQIKCIYIDPPYNTGNENWVYNDNVNSPELQAWLGRTVGKEAEDLSRHDKWLCMMYPRLTLLRKLLKNDGVIFISIDDNEQANLKLLCDEIFGVGNFVTSIVWQARQSIQNDTDISVSHEYILVYAKNRRQENRRLKATNEDIWHKIEKFAFYPLALNEDKFENPDNDIRGKWKADPFDAPNIRENLTYPIENPITKEIFYPPKGRCWRTEREKYAALLADNRIIFGKNGTSKPQLKVFYNEKIEFGTVSNTWFTGENNGTATHGTKELQKIFVDKVVFDTPKPTSLIENLLKISTKNNDIILDSFAGSGTTAHAVLNLNQADGGNRKFILIECQDYAETITAERVRRIISPQGLQALAGVSSGFSFYKLGEPLLIDEQLNSACELEDIRQYIWYTEAGSPNVSPLTPEGGTDEITSKTPPSGAGGLLGQYFLGSFNETDIYFYYEKDKATYLDYDFLATISQKAEHYLIYADVCYLSKEFLEANHIRFKKIPRDITRI
jgi:adenine-specific DNA-methyltransferase